MFSEIGGNAGGTSGGHVCKVSVYLTPPEVRPIGTSEFARRWRKRAGMIPGVESLSFQSDFSGPASGPALTVELAHPDIKVLERASGELAEALRPFPNVRDIDDGFLPGKEQFDFRMRPEGQSIGLSAFEVARQVRSAFYGAEALRQQRGRNEVKVMVRLPVSQRLSQYDVEELLIRTPGGREVPLREVVDVVRGRSYTVINRRNGKRTVTVTADVEPAGETGQVVADLKAGMLPALTRKYAGLAYSFQGRQGDIAKSLSSVLTGFFLAMLVIYGLLAVPFRSYIQPAIVMVSIPFGFVGAVIGHLIMGYTLSIMSFMGIVALSGVVVNDSLILIDFANRRRREGSSASEAMHAATILRFRPIMLTTLTTFGGLAPMIFEKSMQARFMIPMALSLGYGILFATGISLILVPCLFLVAEDMRRLFGIRNTLPLAAKAP